MSGKPITTIKSLHQHLQWALELEHSTIPPYLCALYSLQPGSNAPAAEAIRAVVMEEMLHMVLVANVLNAVGGQPDLDHPKFVPRYPHRLPHTRRMVKLHLRRFAPETLDGFMAIERPEAPGALPESRNYETIGQFYDAIADGLKTLCGPKGRQQGDVFTGSASRQIDPRQWYYGAAGQPIVVTDLASSLAAIGEIKLQGEGNAHSIWEDAELSHFYRYEQIRLGRAFTAKDTPASGPTGALLPVDWDAVLPMRADPKLAQYADQPDVQALMRGFNRTYTELLKTLHQAFDGQPGLMMGAVPVMYRLKQQALVLMQVPCAPGSEETVGPSFELEA
jgi:hypothetical protein